MINTKLLLLVIIFSASWIAYMTYNRGLYLPADCCTKRILLSVLIVIAAYMVYSSSSATNTSGDIEGFYADPVAPSCPKGYVIKNVNGACTCEQLPLATCPSGYTFSNTYGKCVADPSCPPNYTRNPQTNVCQSTLTGSCPEPGQWDAQKLSCVATDMICPAGYVKPFADHPNCCLPPDMQKPDYCAA